MADPKSKVTKNVEGKFYVDVDCIDCDLCRTTAPENFEANEDDGYSYVSKQPSSPEEIDQCEQALQECPVEAIGSDGA
ncbi:MAG: ferredoxin [Planctomycetota bacterium]